jgi:hypothetical protein
MAELEIDPGTPKLSVTDFAAKIKAKYPQYSGVDDRELTDKIIAKYPNYASTVDLGDGIKKKSQDGSVFSPGSPLASPGSAKPTSTGVEDFTKSVFTRTQAEEQAADTAGFRKVNTVAPAKTPRAAFAIDDSKTNKEDIARDLQEQEKEKANPGTWKNTVPMLTHAITKMVTKPLAGLANIARDYTGGAVGAIPLYDENGNQSEYGKAVEKNGSTADPLAGFIMGLDSYNNETEKSDVENALPHTFLGNTASAMINIAPDLAVTALLPEAEIASELSAVNVIKGAVANPFTKLLAFKGATSGYDEAKQRGEGAGDALVGAAVGGGEGALEGATMHLLGGIAGDVVSPAAYKALTKSGILKSGKFTKAGIDAFSDAAVFGAYPIAQSLVAGKPINIDEIESGIGLGLAFGGLKAMKTIEANKIPEADVQNITGDRRAIAVQNFMHASPEAIKEAYDITDTPGDIYAKAVDYAHQVRQEVDIDKKNQLAAAASTYAKASDVKGTVETILHDKDGFVKSIAESQIPDAQKEQLIQKVEATYKAMDPIEIQKTGIGQEISKFDDEIGALQNTIAEAKLPEEKNGHYLAMNDLIGKRLESQNKLFELSKEQEQGKQLRSLEGDLQAAHDRVVFRPETDTHEAHWISPTVKGSGYFVDKTEEGVRAQIDNHYDKKLNEIKPAEPVKYFTSDVKEEPAVSFTTAKGSTYQINEDGTTTRNKKYRPEHGPDEQGPQPKSSRTYYVTEEEANKLGEVQATPGRDGQKYFIAESPDGKIGVGISQEGTKAKVLERSIVKPQTEPAVGLIPVEIWEGQSQPHFGNKITEIVRAEPKVAEKAPEAAKPADPEMPAAQPERLRENAIDLISHGLIHQENASAGETNARFDLEMTAAEKRKAVIDIKKGKFETAPAKKMLAKVMEFEAKGEYPIIEGTGGNTLRRRAATAAEMQEQLNAAKKYTLAPDLNIPEINDGLSELGFTHEDFVNYENYRTEREQQRAAEAAPTEPAEADVQRAGNDGAGSQAEATGGETAQAEPAGAGDGRKPVKAASDDLGEFEIVDHKADGTVSIKTADGAVEDVPAADQVLLGIKPEDVDAFRKENGIEDPAAVEGPKSLDQRIEDLAKKIREQPEADFTDEETTLFTHYEDRINENTERMANDAATAEMAEPNVYSEEPGKRKRGRPKMTDEEKEAARKRRESSREYYRRLDEDYGYDAKGNYVGRKRGAKAIEDALTRAALEGAIPKDSAKLGIELLRANPELYKDLAMGLAQAGDDMRSEGGGRTLGQFTGGKENFIQIFKGSDAKTVIHEMFHYTEQYLPEDIRNNIHDEWYTAVDRKLKAIDMKLMLTVFPSERKVLERERRFFELADQAQSSGSLKRYNEIHDELSKIYYEHLDKSYYQYFNPSEWWTENASDMLAKMKGVDVPETWIGKAVEWYKGLVKTIQKVLGIDRTKHVEEGLNAVLEGRTLTEPKNGLLTKYNRPIKSEIPDERPVREPNEPVADFAKRLREYLEEKRRTELENKTKETEARGNKPEPEAPEPAPDPEAEPPRWNLEDETLIEKWATRFGDFLTRMGKVQKAIEHAGGRINERTDYHTAADLQGSKAANHIRELEERMIKSPDKKNPAFFERAIKEGVTKTDLDDFLRATHVEEYNREIANRRRKAYELELDRLEKSRDEAVKRNNEKGVKAYDRQIKDLVAQRNKKFLLMEDGASGMTNAEAKAMLDKFEQDGKADVLKKYADEFVQEVSNRQLDVQLETGVIDQDTYDVLRERYKHYVPFQVEDFLEEKAGRILKKNSSTGLSRVDNIIRRAKGSTEYKAEQRVSPSTFGLVQLGKAYIEGEINKTSNILYNLVEQNPNDNVFQIVPPKYAPTYSRKGAVTGFREITDKKTIDNSVQLYRDGRKMYVEIKDPILKRTIKKEGMVRIPGKVGEVLDNTYSYLRTVNTLKSPEFWVTNFVKDVQAAGFNLSTEQQKGLAAKMAKGVFPAMRAIVRYEHGKREGEWAPMYERYLQAGGKTTVVKPGTDIEKMKSIDKVVAQIGEKKSLVKNTQALVEWISDFGDASELATRLSVFKAGVESGMTDQQAAVLSRNASINFNRKGEWSGLAGQMYIMFNGGMQGKLYLTKKLATSKTARKIYGGVFAAGVLSAAMNHHNSDPDDPGNDFASLSEYEKQNNFIFKNPLGGFIKIPAGHGYNVPYYLGVKTYEVLAGKAEAGQSSLESLNVMFNAFSPVANGTIAQTVTPTEPARWGVQYLENKNAFGSPIYKENKFGAVQPDSHTHFENTDPKFVAAAQGLNRLTGGTGVKSGMVDVSPDVMQWAYQTAAGGLGRTVEQLPEAVAGGAKHAAKGLGLLPESVQLTPMDMNKIPFLHKFYTEGKPGNYKGAVYSALEASGNNEMSGAETNKFFQAAGKAYAHGQLTPDQYKKYTKQFIDNQVRIQMGESNPNMEKKDFDAIKGKKKGFIK